MHPRIVSRVRQMQHMSVTGGAQHGDKQPEAGVVAGRPRPCCTHGTRRCAHGTHHAGAQRSAQLNGARAAACQCAFGLRVSRPGQADGHMLEQRRPIYNFFMTVSQVTLAVSVGKSKAGLSNAPAKEQSSQVPDRPDLPEILQCLDRLT